METSKTNTGAHGLTQFRAFDPCVVLSYFSISVGFCFHAFESILRYFTIIFLQVYTTEILMCHYINIKHHQTICCVHLFHFIVYV